MEVESPARRAVRHVVDDTVQADDGAIRCADAGSKKTAYSVVVGVSVVDAALAGAAHELVARANAAGAYDELARIPARDVERVRKLGVQLDLYSFHDVSPGSAFWHPKGQMIWRTLEGAMRELQARRGYQEVSTPILVDKKLWQQSGHWDLYDVNMFKLEAEGHEFALKPMNCPFHILIYKSRTRSYRELPLRFFEFGTERVTDEATPDISRSERLWAHPGLRPLSGLDDTTSSPIAAYRASSGPSWLIGAPIGARPAARLQSERASEPMIRSRLA